MSRRRIDINEIRCLAADGYVAKAIAAKIGFDHSSVLRSAERHGITLPTDPRDLRQISPFWAAHDATLRQLVEDGATASEAAAKIGTTKNAVIGRASRIGLEWKTPPTKPLAPARPPRPQIEFPPSGRCVWPEGDPRDDDFHFCGERVAGPGMPYCVEHLRRGWRKPADAGSPDGNE